MQETLQGLRVVRIAEQKVQKQPSELTVEVQQFERRPAEKLSVCEQMGINSEGIHIGLTNETVSRKSLQLLGLAVPIKQLVDPSLVIQERLAQWPLM